MGRVVGCSQSLCHRGLLHWQLVLSSAGMGCRLWHHLSPLGRKSVGWEGGNRLEDTNKGEAEGTQGLWAHRDSPEALKDCSTRPTFTTCKGR